MEPNLIESNDTVSPNPDVDLKRNFLRSKWLLICSSIVLLIFLLFGAYFLGTKNAIKLPTKSVNVLSKVTPIPQLATYKTYTDNKDIYSLKMPQNFVPNIQTADLTDSCVVLANYTFVNPEASANEMAALRKKGILIHICYTAKALGTITNKLFTPTEGEFTISSVTPTTVNGYTAFKLEATSSAQVVKDMVVIKSPYEGYIVMSRESNGKEIYDNMVSSLRFIKPQKTVFTSADQADIRQLFSDKYHKDITVTFNYPSPDQNKVSGGAYLPEGGRCFNADRNSSGWVISYIGTSMTDPKCNNYTPLK